jgi:uncharacterized SAM-binding protein YcdF (DUF218 family)
MLAADVQEGTEHNGIRYYRSLVSRIWERTIRGAGILTLAVFFAAALTPASNIIGQHMVIRPADPAPADAIVVLGAGKLGRAILSDESMLRVIHGIELYKRGLAPIIVLSQAADSDGRNSSEVALRAKLAAAMGIPPDAILREETANTTHEESLHISAALRQRHANSILLVTDSLHMRRALYVFERTGLRVQPSVSADYPNAVVSAKDRLWLTMRIVEESAALLYYRAAGYV